MHGAKSYSFLHFVEHLAKAERTDVLFQVLEQKPFLADQAAHLGSFRQGREDLLSFALPLAIRCEDWNRFLRFSLRALNLGKMSRSLASPGVLGSLVSSGWLRLAIDVAEQQPEAASRIQARAIIAGRVDNPARRLPLLTTLGEELQDLALPRNQDDASHLAETLRVIAREIAPGDWPDGERMLAPLEAWPDLIDTVWIAAAAGCLRRSGLAADELWSALGRVQNPERLRALLPFPLADSPGELDPQRLRERLPALPSSLFWPTSFALLGRQARKNPEDAVRSFDAVSQAASIPWSVGLIETGADLFRNLRAERIRRLAEGIPDDAARAALWTLCLEDSGDQRTARAACEAMVRLPPGPDQIHWSLRYLRADRVSPIDHIRRHTEAARLFLLQTGYAAPPRDLALYLDQIAEMLPERCAGELQNIVGNLADLASLRELAEAITSPSLWLELHERAEEMTAVVARGRREAVPAASQILASLAARLCLARGDLGPLQITLQRLPPGQEDELRVAVGERLHRAGALELADDAVAGIRSTSVRRTALLDLRPERAERLFREPASLYAAFAHIEAVEDERLGLTALHASPAHLDGLADGWLRRMTPGPTATAAVIRMARHALALQSAGEGQQRDVLAILHFVERSLTAGSLQRSSAWLPAIVELGASLGGHRLPLELQAAASELLSRPWEETREVHERLVFHLRTSLPPRQGELALHVLFRALGEIPDGDNRRERTLQLLPLLAAAAEQLPGMSARRMFQHAAAAAFREDPSPSPAGFVAQVCAFDQTRRIEAAEHFARGPDEIIQGPPFHALALLVGHAAPETAVALVRRTPQDDQRDDACRRMIRYQWVPPAQARELLAMISHPAHALEAALFLEEAPEPWLQNLARITVSRGFDPSTPDSTPILDKLWQIDSRLSRPCLAGAVAAALQTDPDKGEQAIRLWLHAHLPPRLGAARAEGLQQSTEVAGVLHQALALATPDTPQPRPSSLDSAPSPAEIGRMAAWLRRWQHAKTRTFLWTLRREDTWAVPHAFLATAILFVLADFELDFKSTEAWGWPWRLLALPFRLLVWTHTSPAWMAVLAVLPLNALLLHRFLEQDTPHEDLRPWISKLRCLLGGLPLFGLYMIPAWRKIMKSRPSWAFRRTRQQILDESRTSASRRPDLAPGSWLAGLHSSPRFLFFWLWIVNLVAVRLATSRLSAADILPADLRPAVDMSLHLLGFAATAFLLRVKFRDHPVAPGDRRVCWLLAGTWIFPFPVPLLALFSPGYAWARRQTTGTLTTGTQGTGSPPEWALLLKLLREHARKIPVRQRPWGLEFPQRTGLAQQKFLSLCRTKTFLLIPDAMLLTLVFWKMIHGGSPWAGIAALLFAGFVFGIIFLQLAGWGAWRVSAVRRLVHSAEVGDRNEPHPYVRALAITAAAAMAGIQLGLSLAQEKGFFLGLCLVIICVVGILAMVLPELSPGSVGPSLRQFFKSLIARQLLFLTIGYLGFQALQGGEQATAIMGLLTRIACLSPALALGIGLVGHPRLLQPFRVRDLFAARLPLRARLVLAFLLLTLALPLGGLAIPFWIRARQRHWPTWERELLPATGETP